MIDLQLSFLESLETQQAFSPANAVLFGQIKDKSKLPVGQSQLTWARNVDYIANVDKNGIKYYYLTKKGIKFLDDSSLKPTSKCTDESPCPASVGGDIDPDMTDSMLEEPVVPPAPDYVPKDVAFNQHTDSFINATNENKPIVELIEFVVVDHGGDIACEPFEIMSDAINHAHYLASVGGEYSVIRKATRKMGTAKPITTTQWVAA